VIERGRKHITILDRAGLEILDRAGLEKESCECYRLVRDRIAAYPPKTYRH
jgi:hypothetical protein